jgi:alkaline phosphatase D
MTLDDHEIEDNWPSHASQKDMMVKYPAAIHSYQIYQMSHSPLIPVDANGKPSGTPDRFYYKFRDGCCDFFVTDTRTERDPDSGEMISDAQMEALLQWLADDSQRVKFVVTSVPFFPDAKKDDKDKWGGYREQRDRIIAHIREHTVRKVVFLAGDVHCSMAAELNVGDTAHPLKIYSVISSSFYWPYPHMKRRHFQLSGRVASAVSDDGYQLGHVTNVYSGDNFSRVRVSPTSLMVEVYERKGDLKHSVEFSF